jgi:diguanylate cyclase (GGDEF)-like protein
MSRILVADDEPRLLDAYRLCLEASAGADDLDDLSDRLFGGGESRPKKSDMSISVDYVDQGEKAVEAVRASIAAGEPYSVFFLDMRMPPGMDGRDTAKLVRELDPNLNIVIVTGYSDHSPLDVAQVAGPQDKLFYLAKPFETEEIRTLARSLTAKHKMEDDLHQAHQALAEKIIMLEAAQLEISASEARCRHIALHDQLTRLPNRLSFQEALSEALTDRQQEVAVLFVDLDRFKLVNDTLGHSAGDELVCRLAERLARSLPETGLVARLGGDEFGIVVHGEAAGQAAELAARLVSICSEQYDVMGANVHIGASIGIALREGSNADGSELLRRADIALYSAKQQGRNCYRLFDPTLDESSRLRADIDSRLRKALDANLLTLAYQPIVDPFDGKPMGYEALLRWEDPEHGAISPAIFVPIAEETGLILKLGEWVVRRALADAAVWLEGVVSINLSTRHFQSPSLVDFVVAEAAKAGVPHDRIQLEITETALFDDATLAAEILVNLRKVGIKIALDDFGTGYSSLVNLKDFEIDCIKIDQSFVATLGADRQASAIVNSVTSLARTLGLKVVAEGVESEMQVQALRLVGCELMQGYFYSAPMNVAALPYLCEMQHGDALIEVLSPIAGHKAAAA